MQVLIDLGLNFVLVLLDGFVEFLDLYVLDALDVLELGVSFL